MPDGESNITPTGTPKLTAALAKAQAAIKGAVKAKVNPHFRSNYADLAALWEAVREPLTTNGLAIIHATRVTEHGHVILRSTLLHTSGEERHTELPLMTAKNDMQGITAALTYGKRGNLGSLTGVVAEDEDDDGNKAAGHTNSATKDTSPPPQVAEKAKPRAKPVAAVEPRDADKPKIKAWCDHAFDHIATATHMDTVLAWENDNRAALDRLASTWTAQYERLSLVLKEKYAELEPANA